MEDPQPSEHLLELFVSELFVDPIAGSDASRDSNSPSAAIGTQSQPFKTLSHALSQATSGTIIYLQPGRYDTVQGEQFPLQIPVGVVVVGDVPTRGERTTIVGGGDWESSIFGRQNVALVIAEQAQVRGVTITNPHEKGTGIWIEAATATIAHCRLSGCGREGIFVTGEATPTILNCWLLQNRASGIAFTRYAKGEIQRSLFCQNRFGVTLSDFASPIVYQTEITDNQVGMVLSGASRPVLRENRIAANTGEGLVIFSQAMPDLGDRQSPGGNYFQDNGDFAIRNVGAQLVIAAGNLLHPLSVRGAIEFRALQPVQTGGWDAESFTAIVQPQSRLTSDPTAINLPETPPDLVNHWSLPFVLTILDRRIMGCFADRTFQPDRPVSRAQFAAVVVRAFQQSDRSPNRGVRDVPTEQEAAAPIASPFPDGVIAQAERLGFVEREADLHFSPEQPLPRWQAIVGLVRGRGLSGGRAELLRIFRDRAEIPSIAVSAVATAVAHQLLILPQRDRLAPLLPITRAELATWIYQALILQDEAEARESPAIVEPTRAQDWMQNLAVPTSSLLQVPRLTASGEGLRVAIHIEIPIQIPLEMSSDLYSAQEESPLVQAGLWVGVQVAEHLEQVGVAADLIQSRDHSIDFAERLTRLQQTKPDLLLQICLVAVSPERGAMGVQTQYAPSESQPYASLLHHKLLGSLDLPDREVVPLPELPYPLAVPMLKVELGLLEAMLNHPDGINRSFCTYVAIAIHQGLLEFLLV
ncbi:DUF1565 domain-containing protein [Leptolyngbya sp. FACHB-711]|uniref:DUF1565 domain-containing protein n=1 Tax=unclassified Leptolyngbya TaxID=2650499 RepID=UPI00168A1448|nr:DUF1565 domain-containing protein [Leptolyngbya sp. FACHB-711]MBD1852388.1 DUF1565 domain-containing protein [Cyanobacteria bacterium FACHB-502]MBD2024329.1 DUF1565 domain-containing protein [Leptolyngbya sp. FACHB-711]